MQFKSITAIAVMLLVVAVSASGCINGGNDVPQPTATSTAKPTATSADLAARLNSALINENYTLGENYTLVKPFTRAVNQYGNVVYAGVFKDGEATLVPYVHNMTIEETKNRNETITLFNAYVAQARTMGYSLTYNTTGQWEGAIGERPNPNNIASVQIIEPNNAIAWYNTYIKVYDSNYTVVSEYETKA